MAEIAEQILTLSVDTAAAIVNGHAGTSLWCDGHRLASVVGQTMFWANHYFVPDPLGARLIEGRLRADSLSGPIRQHLAHRQLIESGLVVPFPTDIAIPWIAERVSEATKADLAHEALVEWARRQLRLEGPTAREVLLVSALDDHEPSSPYMFGRLDQPLGHNEEFSTTLLGTYDSQFDYEPWISTVRSQHVARLVQETNIALAMGDLIKGRWLAPSPFRARLAQRMGVPSIGPDCLADINVPWLPDVDLETLSSLAKNEAAVDELRKAVARCVDAVGENTMTVDQLQLFVDEHAGAASGRLDRTLRNERTLKKLVPGAAVAGTLAISATLGPIGWATGALSAVATGAPLISDYLTQRRSAPFLFWAARNRSDRRGG